MRIVTFQDREYTVRRLGPLAAFNVLRRIGPLLAVTGQELLALLDEKDPLEQVARLIHIFTTEQGTRFAYVLSQIPDDDVAFIIRACLSQVFYRQGDVSSPLWGEKADVPAFEWVTPPIMVRLVVEMIRQEFQDFLAVSPSRGAVPATPQA